MADDDLVIRALLRDEVGGPARQVRRELRETAAEAERLGKGGVSAGKGLDKTTAASKTARSAVRDLDTGLKSASNSLGNELEKGAKRGITALGLITGATAAFGLKASSDFQQSRIAFQALLGDVAKGNDLFAQLQTINVKTPFQLNEIAPATQLLLRYGVAQDKVVPVLKSLLDAAALSGAPAENLQRLALATGQVISQGRILGQDARQLAESGINVYDLIAQKLGITQAAARKLGEEGKLSSELFVQGLINMEGPLAKLQGGAEKLSGTLFGQLSNLKDAVRIRLSDAASPLTEELTRNIAPITALVGQAVDTFGPPVFQLVGFLVDGLSKGLPIIAPLLALIVTGLGRLLTAAGPALDALGPLGGRLGASITDLFDALVPVMPDVVNLLIAMVGVLPDFVKLLADLVPLVTPILQLITGMLGFEPVRKIVATLLAGLLAYKYLSGSYTAVMTFARAVGILGTTSEIAGTKASIAYGRFAALGAIALGGYGVASGLGKATSGKNSLGGDAAFIGSGALLGAGIGSIVPGVGTLVGAGVGGGLAAAYTGLGHLVGGDPVVAGPTMNGHMAAAGNNSLLRITSGQRGWGVRSRASGHVSGRAVDVAGPGLGSYVQRVRAGGGWAVMEGTGAGMHAHSQPLGDPAGTGTSGMGAWGRGPVIYNANFNGPINGIADLRAATRQIFRELQREDDERAYTPVLHARAS